MRLERGLIEQCDAAPKHGSAPALPSICQQQRHAMPYAAQRRLIDICLLASANRSQRIGTRRGAKGWLVNGMQGVRWSALLPATRSPLKRLGQPLSPVRYPKDQGTADSSDLAIAGRSSTTIESIQEACSSQYDQPTSVSCPRAADRQGRSRCLGREAMAALAVGLAGLGMTGRHPAAVRATGPFKNNQASNDLLGLAAPDPVLLASPDREGQAGIPHWAGRTDRDGLSLEVLGVGEERVVVGRHDLEAGGLVTPATNLGHAARPPCGHGSRASRLTMGGWAAASDGLAARWSRASGGRCRRS
jgi:hypothetical protein